MAFIRAFYQSVIEMQHKNSVLPRATGIGCYCGGVVNWRTFIIHWVAKAVGLHIKIEGMPLGTIRNLDKGSVESSMDTGCWRPGVDA